MGGDTFPPDSQELSRLVEEVTASLKRYENADSAASRSAALRSMSESSQRLKTASAEPADAFSDFTFQPLGNAVVRIALSMRLFDKLADGASLTADELAAQTGAEAAFTARIARALAALGFLHAGADDRYSATPLAQVYTDASRRAWSIWMWDVMTRASGAVGPYFEEHPLETPALGARPVPFAWANGASGDIFEIVKSMGKLQLLHEAMGGSSELCAKEAVATYDFSQLSAGENDVAVVDVGGGMGQTLLEIKRTNPELKGRMVLQDLPSTIEGGMVDGVEAEPQGYDFFKQEQPVKGARAYYFQRIFHDWGDEKSNIILQHLKPAMTAQSKLLICDVVVPDSRPHPRKVLRDMNMFLVGGKERSESEWRNLLEGQGFTIDKIHGLENPNNSIVEARLA